MPKVIIRKYTDGDEITVKEYMSKNDNRHYVKDIDDWSRDKIIVAEYGGVSAGYLFASIAAGNCQAYLYVPSKYRRRGIGAALCHEAERLCREKGEKEMWGMYYDAELAGGFTDKLGFYFTTSSIDMEYTGDIIPEPEITRNIRRCREEDYLRCQYIWNKGMHEMRIRVGYPDSKMTEITEEGKKEFAESNDNFVLEDGGQTVGYGVISGDSIGSLAVDTEKFNKGYGTALAIFMTNEILRRGHKTAYSGCESKNINSRRVHEKTGYKITDTCYTSFKKTDLESEQTYAKI